MLSLHNSTHWGCIRTILTAGLLGALCVNIIMHVFGLPLSFAFHPSAVSFATLPWLPPSQPASCSAIYGWGSAWEGKYSSFVGLQRSDWEAGQPAVLTAGKRGWRPSLRYISSLVLSHFSCGHPFCLWLLLVGQSVLRAATFNKRGLGSRHTTCLTSGRTLI